MSNAKKKRILLVEDEQMSCLITGLTLELLCCSVDVANDGKKAVELACRNHYDLILMDIGLPQLDGIGACNEIRQYESQHAPGKHTPIIAVTADTDTSKIDDYLHAGMVDVLFKPVNKQQLANALEKIF